MSALIECAPFLAVVMRQPPRALVVIVGRSRAALLREFLVSIPSAVWTARRGDWSRAEVLGRPALLLDASDPRSVHRLCGCDIGVFFVDDAVRGVDFWGLMWSRLRQPGSLALTWSGMAPWFDQFDAPTDAT